jgi:hypothetical protein
MYLVNSFISQVRFGCIASAGAMQQVRFHQGAMQQVRFHQCVVMFCSSCTKIMKMQDFLFSMATLVAMIYTGVVC